MIRPQRPRPGCGCLFCDLAFLVKLSPSFSPHLGISGEEQVLDSGCLSAFPPEADALLQPCGATGPVMHAVFWGFTKPGHPRSTDPGGKGLFWTGLHSSSSVRDMTSIHMDCSYSAVWLGHKVRAPVATCSLVGRETQEGKAAERGVLAPLCHLPSLTLDSSCYLPEPLRFLQQSKDTGSEGTAWFPGSFAAALKCHLWLWLARFQQGLYNTWEPLNELWSYSPGSNSRCLSQFPFLLSGGGVRLL